MLQEQATAARVVLRKSFPEISGDVIIAEGAGVVTEGGTGRPAHRRPGPRPSWKG